MKIARLRLSKGVCMRGVRMSRRTWVGMGAALLIEGRRAIGQQSSPPPKGGQAGQDALPLERYEPKSALHTTDTQVPRARFPVIDFHTHITGAAPGANPEAIRFSMDPAKCLEVMDRRN